MGMLIMGKDNFPHVTVLLAAAETATLFAIRRHGNLGLSK